jgi:hypothetical protein
MYIDLVYFLQLHNSSVGRSRRLGRTSRTVRAHHDRQRPQRRRALLLSAASDGRWSVRPSAQLGRVQSQSPSHFQHGPHTNRYKWQLLCHDAGSRHCEGDPCCSREDSQLGGEVRHLDDPQGTRTQTATITITTSDAGQAEPANSKTDLDSLSVWQLQEGQPNQQSPCGRAAHVRHDEPRIAIQIQPMECHAAALNLPLDPETALCRACGVTVLKGAEMTGSHVTFWSDTHTTTL